MLFRCFLFFIKKNILSRQHQRKFPWFLYLCFSPTFVDTSLFVVLVWVGAQAAMWAIVSVCTNMCNVTSDDSIASQSSLFTLFETRYPAVNYCRCQTTWPTISGELLPLSPPSPCRRTGFSEVCYLIWIWISASSTEPSSQPHLTVFITTASSAVWSHSSFWLSYPWTAKNYLCWILFKPSFGHLHISIEKVSLGFLSSILFLLIN